MAEILYKQLSYAVVGAAMEVHCKLGPGFLEAVYQASLAHELTLRGIRFEQFRPLPVTYKDIVVGNYEADFIVEDLIVLELKAVPTFHPRHTAQAVNYLAAGCYRLAILLNFGAESFQFKRLLRRRV